MKGTKWNKTDKRKIERKWKKWAIKKVRL
jgi:hypothetical protein